MFPFRTSSIFRSRWMALLWASGFVWMAIDVADSPPAGGNQAIDADGAPGDSDQMKQAEKILEHLNR